MFALDPCHSPFTVRAHRLSSPVLDPPLLLMRYRIATGFACSRTAAGAGDCRNQSLVTGLTGHSGESLPRGHQFLST
jgi:hypothetical protein